MKTNHSKYWLAVAATLATGLMAQAGTNAPPAGPTASSAPASPVAGLTNASKAKPALRKPAVQGTSAASTRSPDASQAGSVLKATPGLALVVGNNVNVRSQPALKSEVIAKLSQGAIVTVLEEIALKNPGSSEPARWVRIAYPPTGHTWVYAKLIDGANQTVLAEKLNVRAGPGEKFGVVGVLRKGDAVKTIITRGDWIEIVAPANAYAFIAAQYLRAEMVPVPRKSPPARVEATVARPAPDQPAASAFRPLPPPARVADAPSGISGTSVTAREAGKTTDAAAAESAALGPDKPKERDTTQPSSLAVASPAPGVTPKPTPGGPVFQPVPPPSPMPPPEMFKAIRRPPRAPDWTMDEDEVKPQAAQERSGKAGAEDARKKAEAKADRQRLAEEKARAKAEAEAARKQAEAEARKQRLAEADAQKAAQAAEAQAKAQAAKDRRAKAEAEDARKKAEAEAGQQRLAEEKTRAKAEAEEARKRTEAKAGQQRLAEEKARAEAEAAVPKAEAMMPDRAQAAPAKPEPAPADKTVAGETAPAYTPMEQPASPVSEKKARRLEELLQKYRADEITPEQYYQQRGKILAEP